MGQSDYGKFTREEILSQPKIWEQVIRGWAGLNIEDFPNPANYDQVLFIGCGSTFYLSRWAARMNEFHTGVFSRSAPSSDLLLYPDHWLNKEQKTLLVASSRSAATTETVRAIDRFQQHYQGDVVVITCYGDQQMASQTEFVISAEPAQEQSIAQTRSFSSMMLGQAFFISRGLPTDIGLKLRQSGQLLLDNYFETINSIANNENLQRFFFLGSGPFYGLASECMLKMKEITLSYSESFHSMEFRHGPMSMVNENTLVIGLLGENNIEQEFAVLREMKVKGAKILAIAESLPEGLASEGEQIILNSGLTLLWRSPLYLPAMQWLAYSRGMIKGLNPDRPHNLDAVVVLDE